MAMCSVLIKGDVLISGHGVLLWRDCTQCIIICIIMTYKFIIILFRLLAPSHPAAGFSSQSYNNNNKYMYMYMYV